MAEYGFYRGSGAAWQRALPPELRLIADSAAVWERRWELLVLDREGARRLSGQGPGPVCRTLLLPHDNKELYNIGSSLKDIGKKCSSINKIEDTFIIKELLDRIKAKC